MPQSEKLRAKNVRSESDNVPNKLPKTLPSYEECSLERRMNQLGGEALGRLHLEVEKLQRTTRYEF